MLVSFTSICRTYTFILTLVEVWNMYKMLVQFSSQLQFCFWCHRHMDVESNFDLHHWFFVKHLPNQVSLKYQYWLHIVLHSTYLLFNCLKLKIRLLRILYILPLSGSSATIFPLRTTAKICVHRSCKILLQLHPLCWLIWI